MTSLVSPADVDALVKTSLDDDDLQKVIDRVEAEIASKVCAVQDEGGTVEVILTLNGEGTLLFLPVEIASVTSIVEDDSTLLSGDYRLWAGGQIERLPEDAVWGDRCVVTFKPEDDRSLRTQVIIELVRLDLERTAMLSENVAGEYSYNAPNWEAARNKQIKRLMFQAV